ncbi:MAG: drug/metabolite transporter (DMT)-like permease [Hyphomicrobiaceae bacterium]|jgi:drug/metabolite transporter (DMT)-like permease
MTQTQSAPIPTQGSPALGMLLMVLAMTLIPVMDGLAKILSSSYPTLEIVWARYFFHFALLLPLVLWRYGRQSFVMKRPWLQLLRGSTLVVATVCFFGSIADIPLADALAIVFVYPFIVTALSPALLGDQVGIWRWTAVIVGFAGALIIIRPGFQEMSPAMLLALGAGCMYAIYVLITRKMAGSDPPLKTLLMTGVVGTIATTFTLPFVWITPTAPDLAIMISLGVLAAIGHYMIIVAHEWASAPQLAPYSYVEIVAATTVGYVLFGDLPEALTWLGIIIIVFSGIVIAWREGYVTRRERKLTLAKPQPTR